MVANAYTGRFTLGIFLLVFSWKMTGGSGEVMVSLEMPRFASKGSRIALQCNHNVEPELLYKVEWLREDYKIFQYVRERKPPFRHYPVVGAQLNTSISNERTIVLEELEFSATGIYHCEVSLETPIFTKASADKELLVIQPQRHPPRITFGAPLYTAGELVEANCTTSPAHPAPHITWFINGIKVDPMLSRSFTRLAPIYRSRKRHRATRSHIHPTQHPQHPSNHVDVGMPSMFVNGNTTIIIKSCSARDVYGDLVQYFHKHPARQTLQQMDEYTSSTSTEVVPTVHHHKPGHLTAISGPGTNQFNGPPLRQHGQRLSITVSALRLSAGGKLSLTCLSTIPAYKGPSMRYADSRNHTVIIDIVIAEELEPMPTEPPLHKANEGNKPYLFYHLMILPYLILLIIIH